MKNKVELVPALRDAMAAENDFAAAREEMLALGRIDGKGSHDLLFAAASRFNGALDGVLLTSLAQRGPGALSLASRLRGLKALGLEWEYFFHWAARGGGPLMEMAVDAALENGSPESWEAVLKLSERKGHAVGDASLARSIREGSSYVRTLTYWYLLRRKGTGAGLSAETYAVLKSVSEPPPGTEGDPITTLAFELLSRSLGRPPVDRTELMRTLPRGAIWPIEPKVGELLNSSEAEVLAPRFGGYEYDRAFVQIGADGRRQIGPAGMKGSLQGVRVRTASNFPPGVVANTLAVSGCVPPKEPALAGLEARFDENGVLSQIGEIPMSGPKAWLRQGKACEAATRALLMLSVQPTDRPPPPNSRDVILLPLVTDYLECSTAQHAPPPRPDSKKPTGPIEGPRRTKNVDPIYPERASKERRSGMIVMEAEIAPEGCIRSLEVVAGEHADLAVQAIVAVAQWRYTPSLVEGQPVPTMMRTSVTFQLR